MVKSSRGFAYIRDRRIDAWAFRRTGWWSGSQNELLHHQVGGRADRPERGHAGRQPPAVLHRPAPHHALHGRLHPRLPPRRGPGPARPRRPRPGARALLPNGRPLRRVPRRRPRGRLHRGGRVVRRGLGGLRPRGREQPRAASRRLQGAGAPLSSGRGHEGRDHGTPGDGIQVRGFRGGYQSGSRHGWRGRIRSADADSGRDGERPDGAVAEAGVGQGGDPRAAEADRAGASAGLPSHGPREARRGRAPGSHQRAEEPFRGGDGAEVLDLRRRARGGVAEQDAGDLPPPGRRNPRGLRGQHGPPDEGQAAGGLLRQLRVPADGRGAGGKGGGGDAGGGGGDYQGGEAAPGAGVRRVDGGRPGGGPVPGGAGLRAAGDVGLEQGGVQRAGLRLGAAGPRRPGGGRQPVHRELLLPQAAGAEAGRAGAHELRRGGALGGLPGQDDQAGVAAGRAPAPERTYVVSARPVDIIVWVE